MGDSHSKMAILLPPQHPDPLVQADGHGGQPDVNPDQPGKPLSIRQSVREVGDRVHMGEFGFIRDHTSLLSSGAFGQVFKGDMVMGIILPLKSWTSAG